MVYCLTVNQIRSSYGMTFSDTTSVEVLLLPVGITKYILHKILFIIDGIIYVRDLC